MLCHNKASSLMMTQTLGPKVGVVPQPTVDPKNPVTLGSMTGNVIYTSSKNKEAAFTFISWLTETAAMDKWSASRQGQVPALKSVARMPRYTEDIFTKLSLDSSKYALYWPPLPGVGYVSAQVWQANMQRAFLGQISSKDMLDEIAKALQR
jgi:multiple sugar transport system substrate-binding protein